MHTIRAEDTTLEQLVVPYFVHRNSCSMLHRALRGFSKGKSLATKTVLLLYPSQYRIVSLLSSLSALFIMFKFVWFTLFPIT